MPELRATHCPELATPDLPVGGWKLQGTPPTMMRCRLPDGELAAVPLGDGRWRLVDPNPATITIGPSINTERTDQQGRRVGWHGHLIGGVWRWP